MMEVCTHCTLLSELLFLRVKFIISNKNWTSKILNSVSYLPDKNVKNPKLKMRKYLYFIVY